MKFCFEKTNFLLIKIYKIKIIISVVIVAIPAPKEPYFGINKKFNTKSDTAPIITQQRYVFSLPCEFNTFPPQKPDTELKKINGIIVYIVNTAVI